MYFALTVVLTAAAVVAVAIPCMNLCAQRRAEKIEKGYWNQ
jgi:hypothetical protein